MEDTHCKVAKYLQIPLYLLKQALRVHNTAPLLVQEHLLQQSVLLKLSPGLYVVPPYIHPKMIRAYLT